MTSPALTVTALSVSYGEVQALSAVDIECPLHGRVAILGANAAGKSSLLRALTGLAASRGSVTLLGRPLDRLSSAARVRAGVSLVPEQRQVFAEMSIEENLLLGAYASRGGRRQREQDVHRMYEIFPILAERRGVAAGFLSGGEQQMLAIARGLMARPRVLLMDEPTLGLAPEMAERIGAAIVELSQDLDGLVIAEQNAVWALELCPQVYVLDRGSLAFGGTREDVIKDGGLRAAYLGA